MRLPDKEYRNRIKFLSFASKGDIEGVKKMIYDGVVSIECDHPVKKSKYKRDALFFALRNNHIELADYLVRLGANIKKYGSGLIRIVAHKGSFNTIDYMIEKGWSKEKVNEAVCVNLLGCDKLELLYKFGEHMKIEPIDIIIKYHKKSLKNVTPHFRPTVEEKIKKAEILRRDMKIISIIETS